MIEPIEHYFSFSKVLIKVPMCGRISTTNSSPSFKVTLGLAPVPTPAGVPVIMTVPAGSVVPCDKKLISLLTLKMRSLVSQHRIETINLQFSTRTRFHSLVLPLRSSSHGYGVRMDLELGTLTQ